MRLWICQRVSCGYDSPKMGINCIQGVYDTYQSRWHAKGAFKHMKTLLMKVIMNVNSVEVLGFMNF